MALYFGDDTATATFLFPNFVFWIRSQYSFLGFLVLASCYTNKFFHPCYEICQDLVSQASQVKSIYLRIYGEHNFAINCWGGGGGGVFHLVHS